MGRWPVVAILVVLAAGCGRGTGPARVGIDGTIAYQVMEGFGASNRVWDDPHLANVSPTIIPAEAQREILTRLYTDLGLTRVRPATEADIEPVNDNDDPFTFDWSKFNFAWKRNDAHVDFVKQAMPYGLRVYFLSPIILEKWMTEGKPEEYVEWALAVLLRWRALGQELPYYSIINEPGHWRSGIWSAQWMKAVVKQLGSRMRAEGLKAMLVIPDDINATEAFKRASVVLEDPEARQYVGALAYHLYGGAEKDLARMRDLARQHHIPVWMTEYQETAPTYAGAMGWIRTVHRVIAEYGVSAVDHMWGFFGSWVEAKYGGGAFVSINFNRGRYQGYRLTPAYYLTGQFSRFVRPGYVRIEARSSDDAVLVTAFRGSRDLVIVLINTGRTRRATVGFTGVALPASFVPVRTSGVQNWQQLPPVQLQGSEVSIELPSQSVTTLRGENGAGEG